METKGILATADIWLSEPVSCADIVKAVETMLEDYTVMAKASHQFKPHGFTGVWVLAESHCAIHTYPEHNYFSIDLYTCTDKLHPEESLQTLLEKLPVEDWTISAKPRG